MSVSLSAYEHVNNQLHTAQREIKLSQWHVARLQEELDNTFTLFQAEQTKAANYRGAVERALEVTKSYGAEVMRLNRELEEANREKSENRDRATYWRGLAEAQQTLLAAVTDEARTDTEELHAQLAKAKKRARELKKLIVEPAAVRPSKRKASKRLREVASSSDQ